MKLTKQGLTQIIKEELEGLGEGGVPGHPRPAEGIVQGDADLPFEAYKRVLAKIRKESKGLSNDDSYEFLMLLKEWTDRAVIS